MLGKRLGILLFVFVCLSFALTSEAAYLTEVSDKVSRHAVDTASDHTIQFTTPTGVDASTDQIEIHFPADFDLSAIDYTDVDLSHGPVTGYETEEVLAGTAANGVWAFNVVGQDLVFTAPTDSGLGEIAANDIVIIEIGLNATAGDQQIINPSVSGSYPVYIDGSFGDQWFFALWVGNDQIYIDNSATSTVPPTVQVLSPNGGENILKDTQYYITWTATDDEPLPATPISIYYSINDGSSWELIVSSIANSGVYTWEVPNISATYVKIRVVAEDSDANFGHDDSDNFFRIYIPNNILLPEDEVAVHTETQDRLPTIDGGWAYPGDLIKCPEYTTVYFYGFEGDRRYFPTQPIFLTWYYDFSEVKTVSLESLVTLRLSKNIKARPGAYMVKAVTHPAVYVVGEDSVLHKIPNESLAEKMFGKDWATKILDIPDVFWGDYKYSYELKEGYYPNGTLIKYPNDSRFYLLANQKKRHIANEEAFYANYFYRPFVVEIDPSIQYEDGKDILYRENKLLKLNYDPQ